MHKAVRDWVASHMPDKVYLVTEFGSLDINGGIRDLLPACEYVGVDMQEGPGVHVIADAATYEPDVLQDLIVCVEVFEHAANWRDIIANAAECLTFGGTFIATAAGVGRPPHSGRRESKPDPDEHYCNVSDVDLRDALEAAGFTEISVDVQGVDVRCVARKADYG